MEEMGWYLDQLAGATSEVRSALRQVGQGGGSLAETSASYKGSFHSSPSPTWLARLDRVHKLRRLGARQSGTGCAHRLLPAVVSLCHGLRFKHEVGGCYPWVRGLVGVFEELCGAGLGASGSCTRSGKGSSGTSVRDMCVEHGVLRGHCAGCLSRLAEFRPLLLLTSPCIR